MHDRPAAGRPQNHPRDGESPRSAQQHVSNPWEILAAALGATTVTILGAVDAVPAISFVWQVVTIATFIGGLVAYIPKQQDPGYDHSSLIVRWSSRGRRSTQPSHQADADHG